MRACISALQCCTAHPIRLMYPALSEGSTIGAYSSPRVRNFQSRIITTMSFALLFCITCFLVCQRPCLKQPSRVHSPHSQTLNPNQQFVFPLSFTFSMSLVQSWCCSFPWFYLFFFNGLSPPTRHMRHVAAQKHLTHLHTENEACALPAWTRAPSFRLGICSYHVHREHVAHSPDRSLGVGFKIKVALHALNVLVNILICKLLSFRSRCCPCVFTLHLR